jgi:hypothetical protein
VSSHARKSYFIAGFVIGRQSPNARIIVAMRVFALCLLAACGGTITTNQDGGTDAAPSDGQTSKDVVASDVTTPPFDAGAFCNGTTPKLVINGADATIVQATGKAIILNCCNSAELSLATAQYQAMLNIMWRANPAGAATIDLSNPPTGFGIEMDLGCDPATQSCASASPEERYFNEGFSGTIQYSTGNGPMSVSYCIHVAESASQPHSVIHSMDLYAPDIASP